MCKLDKIRFFFVFLLLLLVCLLSILKSTNISSVDFKNVLPAQLPLHSGQPMKIQILKGDWQEFLKQDYHLYVHKAFIDLRKGSFWGSPAVIITSLLRGSDIIDQNIQCQMKVEGNWLITKAVVKKFSKSWRYEHTGWQYIVIQCPISDKAPYPTHLALQNMKHEMESVFMPIEMPQSGRDKLVVCVPIVYGDFDTEALIEWFEIQKYFGVNKVSFSVWKVSDANWKVFDHYKREGFLDFHRIDTPFDVSYQFQTNKQYAPKKPYFLQTIVGIDAIECMMRNYQRTKHIMMMDLDEVLVPIKFKNYAKFLSNYKKYNHLMLHMISFDVTCNLTIKSESHFFLRRPYRGPLNRLGPYKTIHKTLGCAFFLQHNCIVELNNPKVNLNAHDVSFDDVVLRHYRKRYRCVKKSVENHTVDNSLNLYSEHLNPKLTKAKSNFKVVLENEMKTKEKL